VTTERTGPPLVAGEREMLRAFLDSEACGAWQDEAGHSRRIERDTESLGVLGYRASWGEHASLRLVMLHLMHEYARHNGHANFLREGIDGAVGV
jgi:Protein of unknown function (DUF664)